MREEEEKKGKLRGWGEKSFADLVLTRSRGEGSGKVLYPGLYLSSLVVVANSRTFDSKSSLSPALKDLSRISFIFYS